MKIIKEGIPPEKRRFQVRCWKCQTIFEFFQSEGKVHSDQRDGDYITINCPICKNYVSCNLDTYIKDTPDLGY